MQAYLPAYLKSRNRKLVFDLFLEHRELSRAGITRMTEMSFPTVQKIIEFLLAKNIVTESGDTVPSEDGLGRRSRLLRFNPDAYRAVGLEIEGRFANVGLVNLQGDVLEHHLLRLEMHGGIPDLTILAECINDIFRRNTAVPILGIGIGFPGVINPEHRSVLHSNMMNIRSEIPFREIFPEFVNSIPVPMFLENDVNMACWGENFLRLRMKSDANLVYLSLGTGYGAGLVIDGNLWRGTNFNSGEIGHMVLDKIDASMKKRGIRSLENMVNIDALRRRFHIDISPGCIKDEALRLEICDYLGSYLCFAIYNMLMILDIDTFVLAGVIPDALGEIFYRRLNEQIHLLVGDTCPVRISRPANSSTGVVGGAIMASEHMIFDILKN